MPPITSASPRSRPLHSSANCARTASGRWSPAKGRRRAFTNTAVTLRAPDSNESGSVHQRSTRPTRLCAAFTLSEMMVAFGIFGLAVVGSLYAHVLGLKMSTFTQSKLRATHNARAALVPVPPPDSTTSGLERALHQESHMLIVDDLGGGRFENSA